MSYGFISDAGRIINSGQSRSIVMTGNVSDLFYSGIDYGDTYVPLLDLLSSRWSVRGSIVITYKLNGSLRFGSRENEQKLRMAWGRLYDDDNQQAIDLALARTKARISQLEKNPHSSFDQAVKRARNNATYALEFLRQLCICSRIVIDDEPCLDEYLVILIENADFLIPQGEIGRLSDVDRQRVSICRDWFSDPDFYNADDSVVMLSETISALNSKVSNLPQVLEVRIPSPDHLQREHLINWYDKSLPADNKLKMWDTSASLARLTAGLSSHALIQMLRNASHLKSTISPGDVTQKVEHHIQHLLGEDVVEFKKPEHSLKHVVGFKKLKEFFASEFIPRIKSTGKSALPGAVIGGPIGSGKTFILEAVAGELGIVVLVLKNIRSKWFGDTDVVFERLRGIIQALDKSLIFVDEADTQFGGVGESAHETERRLTGKIQAMMSDPALRGRTSWLLITARIHLLSPDIRRPGRAGSLIIPIFDPESEDRDDFIKWMISPVFKADEPDPEKTDLCTDINHAVEQLKPMLNNYYSAAFAETRADLIATAEIRHKDGLTINEIKAVIEDHVPPAVERTRHYQTLQAMVNCTRLSLLPEFDDDLPIESRRAGWLTEISALEAQGER